MAERMPIYLVHPGEVLAGELQALGVTATQLAREIHVPSNRLYQLIIGKRAMTADLALRLEPWLGVEATFWVNMQKRYELELAAGEVGAEIKRTVRRRTPTVEVA